MAKTRDPNASAQKWMTNLGAAGPSITAGVQAVTTSPGQAAARQADVWAANVAAAKAKFAANVGAYPLAQWQQDTIQKGVPRIAGGATAAQPKMQQFFSQLFPYIDNAVQSLPARGNLQQNMQRMTQFVTKMSQFKKT